MKLLHRDNLYGWSRFDESRNLDFNSVLWVREGGNVAIDPLPLSEHERGRLQRFGGVAHVVLTNSDHVRGARALVEASGAKLYGPAGEREGFPVACDAWLGAGESPIPGLRVVVLEGSKTPGELALVIEETTLVTGDLIRGHRAGVLNLLPTEKLRDRGRAVSSLRELAGLQRIEAVLVGDGWSVFRNGAAALTELLVSADPGPES
jgi:glyoxylase-like metal-dependent hydrolase (beta-lactamase superfamily II)